MDLSNEEAQQGLVEAAKWIASFPGIRWKIWTFNWETMESGAIYLFDDEALLEKYLEGPTIAQAKSQFSDVSIKRFGIMEELTEITHGPIN
jgi:hypothetical protein